MPQNTNEMNREELLRENLILEKAGIEAITRQSEDGRIGVEEFKIRTKELYEKIDKINAELKGIALGRQMERESHSRAVSDQIGMEALPTGQEGANPNRKTDSTPSCLSNEEQEARRKGK